VVSEVGHLDDSSLLESPKRDVSAELVVRRALEAAFTAKATGKGIRIGDVT
jgi:hypothetical protein